MARKERKKLIAFALEAAYGVDAIDGKTPKYVLGREFSVTPMAGENQSLDYDDGTLGNAPDIATEIYVTLEFTVDLAASGTAAQPALYGDIMKACLRDVSALPKDTPDHVEYTIDEDSTGSITLYYYQDGTLHKVTGARGSLSLNIAAKGFGGIKFTFTGLHQPASEAALPTPDFSDWEKPLKIGAQNSAFTYGGKALKLISLEYDQANQVVHQEYVGHEEVLITDYQPTGTLVVEAPKLSEWNPFTLAEAGTESSLVFSNGSGGNQVGFESSRVQLGRPTYGEQDGTQTYSIPLKFISNTDKFVTR